MGRTSRAQFRASIGGEPGANARIRARDEINDMRNTDPRSELPLTPKVFHILVALAEEPRNGYQLGLKVEEASEGKIRLSPGTLYENLHRLAGQGMIREVEELQKGRQDGRGQRFYTVTDRGLAVVRAEMERLTSDLALARSVPALGG